MTTNRDDLPLDFDIVSPELMNSLESLRMTTLWKGSIEDPDDATPLSSDAKLRNALYMTKEGYVFPHATDAPDNNRECERAMGCIGVHSDTVVVDEVNVGLDIPGVTQGTRLNRDPLHKPYRSDQAVVVNDGYIHDLLPPHTMHGENMYLPNFDKNGLKITPPNPGAE